MFQSIQKLAKCLLLFVLLLTALAACSQSSSSTRNKLVVYIVGFGEHLLRLDANKNGGYGYEGTFYSQGGVQPYLQATREFKNTQSMVFSYKGSPGSGKPTQFTCKDTYDLKLVEDVNSLRTQIGFYLQSHPKTDVYLVGHSLGGVIAFAYMAQIVESTHSNSLLNGGELKGVATLDSPLNGITHAKGYQTSMIELSDLCGLSLGIDYTIVSELQTLGNTGSYKGEQASILGTLLNEAFVSNQKAAEDAEKLGIAILIVGNTHDLLWQPNFCGSGENFLSTQYLSEIRKVGKGALYVRSFTSPSGDLNPEVECPKLILIFTRGHHLDVVNNKDVQKAIWETFTDQSLDVLTPVTNKTVPAGIPTPTPTPTPTPVPTDTPTPTPTPPPLTIVGSYSGTANNATTSQSASMTLTQVSVNNGQITGNFHVDSPLGGSGPFTGTVNGKSIRFTVTPNDGVTNTITFNGSINQDGSMSGTYTVDGADQNGNWQVSPSS